MTFGLGNKKKLFKKPNKKKTECLAHTGCHRPGHTDGLSNLRSVGEHFFGAVCTI